MTKTVWCCMGALILAACGGKGFLGDSNQSSLDDKDASANTSDKGANSGTKDDGNGTSEEPAASTPAHGGNSGGGTGTSGGSGEPGSSGTTEPEKPAPTSVEPEPTSTPDPEPSVTDPGSTPPTDGGMAEPDPTTTPDPTQYEPCAGLACGDVCNACPPDVQCIRGPGYCTATGECGVEKPTDCGSGAECPSMCAVPDLCVKCADDSCASPVIACNDDGTCGGVSEWKCADVPVDPEPSSCPETCAVDAICQVCDDGSCAKPNIACNADGTCGEVTWECPAVECKTDADCPEYMGEAPCRVCEATTSDPAFAPPVDPAPTPSAGECPQILCIANACKLKMPCTYEPCEGKKEGDSCQLCAPTDAACTETDEIKACTNGECKPAASVAQ
ncbi:MAG TPA: hypothetical protein VHM70_18315 [Polyangiaceae bacterium]|nr:hypothetical protein [Polyangiaceae bacterium]